MAQIERRYVILGAVVVTSVMVLQLAGGWIREAVSPEASFLEKVQTCLVERNRPFAAVDNDPVARSAGRGALRADVDGNLVTVALGGSEVDAERMYETYVAVASDEVVETRLERRRKVVLLWDQPPTAAQRELMYLCTLDAQE